MSAPKFTPGPWDVIKPRDTGGWGLCVAHTGVPGVIVARIPGRSINTREANAQFIAAAPDMYAAIEEVARGDSDCCDSLRLLARAALAKARGEG